ncbi:ABC-2 type transporter-domain-containing protein [Aspergillus stella-maris]|uniref:ABC-2 type transporter-domain-containing protein n=1 Tax=Aspergillus stella-maris TaxID=1810926 RepID=UPI003CCCB7F6
MRLGRGANRMLARGDQSRDFLTYPYTSLQARATKQATNEGSLPPESSSRERYEWARDNICILGPTTHNNHDSGVLYENLAVAGSGASIQVQQTVLSALMHPIVSAVSLLAYKGRRPTPHSIISGVNGLLCSGELLLVLGRPGSGCSTFLKTITNCLDRLTLDPDCNILYKGFQLGTTINKGRGEVRYNGEEDHHLPSLTVGETLKLAASSRAPKKPFHSMSHDEYVEAAVQAVMALFGLSDTVNTQVGSEHIRGVCGSERKRVSIAEMALARARIGAWDKSTRGLDANSALEFAKALRFGSIYNTFDTVTLLYEGRQIYFGLRQDAVAYFERMGWKRHPRQVSADFLTSVTNPVEREIREEVTGVVPLTPDEFEAYWKQSPEYNALRERMNTHLQTLPHGNKEDSVIATPKRLQASSPYLLRAYRQKLNDRAGVIATAITQMVIAQRASVIFLAVFTNNLISMLEINLLYSDRPVIQKHARYAFVRPSAEALAGAITDLPIKALRCLLASLVVYFLAHLRREPGHFFIYFLFQLISVVSMSGLFRFLAAMTKSIGQAMALAGIVIICVAVYTGFTVPQPDMRPWLAWIRWLNPVYYTFESILVNELHGLSFRCVDYIPMYPSLTGQQFTCSVVGALAGEHSVSGGRYFESKCLYSYDHLWRNLGILMGFLVAFHVAYVFLSEQMPGTVSKPNSLTYLAGHHRTGLGQGDEEKEQSPALFKADQIAHSDPSPIPSDGKDVFSWKNVCYDVPVKDGFKRLLDNVNGWMRPGTLTALMGVSGAGKTTLLNVLAQRMSVGVVTGEVLVNVKGLGPHFCRLAGFVEQHDLHLEACTVREALRFSASLHQSQFISMDEKHAYVETVISVLGVDVFAEALAAKPDLMIFLDEPTSGLDSQTSFAICTFMRRIANHGQAVLATIHQPGAVMFERFDRLLLLAKGGRMAYVGDVGLHSRTVLDYFESNGARLCEPNENPAEYILEVIDDRSRQSLDWPTIWRNSSQHQASVMPPLCSQLYQVIKRNCLQYYRQPDYFIARFGLGIVSGLFIGFSFWNSNNSQQGFQNTLFSLFLLCTIFSTMVNQIMPRFISRRTLYDLREGPSRTYFWKVFMFSQVVVELPWQALLGVRTWASFYFSVYGAGQHPQQQGLILLFVVQFFLYASSFTYLVASAVPSAALGSMLALFMFVMSLLSNGVMQPPSSLPPFWDYMHRVSPLTCYVGGISGTALHGRDLHCSEREMLSFNAPLGQTCGEYMQEFLKTARGALQNASSTGQCHYCPLQSVDQYLADRDIFWDFRWRNYGILWAYFAFNILGAILLYYVFRFLPQSRRKARSP